MELEVIQKEYNLTNGMNEYLFSHFLIIISFSPFSSRTYSYSIYPGVELTLVRLALRSSYQSHHQVLVGVGLYHYHRVDLCHLKSDPGSTDANTQDPPKTCEKSVDK